MSDPSASLDVEQLRRFFDLSLELLAVASTEGHFVAVNPAWRDTLGWTEAQLLAEPFVRFLHPEDVKPTIAEVGRLVQGHTTASFLNRFRHVDGSYRTLRWSARAEADGTVYAAARDVTEYTEALAQAEHDEEMWRTVLRTAVDPIIVIDEMGIVQRANEATTTLLGHREEDIVGHNVSMLMPEPYHSEHDAYLERYMRTGEARIIGIGREVEARCADGSIVPVDLAVSEIPTTSGRLFTGILHDLTPRREIEEQLRDANEQLEQRVRDRTSELEESMIELTRSNRDLEQFAYIASHDLQAPLRNVRQGLELLDEHLLETIGASFDDEAEELRGLVVGAVGTMESLIHGLLSYSRVQRQARPMDLAVDLDAVAAEVLDQLRLDLETADAAITVEDLPTVAGDKTQLRQLLQNLVQNAVKYRDPKRRPEVVISATEAGGRWQITVGDNGIGVDEEQHDRIFELFRRAHPGYEGVGIGLAICQRIVERHGGDIRVESKPGDGATFIFTLPKAKVDDAI